MARREGDVEVIRNGLTFKRFFSEEGVHPFDEIEWEIRDAVIPNYKEGGNAFEQLGVEFPKSWSQNATNIVAQKYFRGTLGTPQRESSVRQLTSRVVDTIRGWGVKDGYFATEKDAQVFADELSHLIVTQKAAFNSPVWFNVGVPDTPQQCSACQPYDALVSTPEGLVPIGKLVEEQAVGAKVYDAHGVTRIVAVKANGVKHVLRIHTKAGQVLDVTADHLVWRSSGRGTGRFVEAGELRPGDLLEWHRRGSWGQGDIDPVGMAEAALAGWLQSDGFVGRYEGTNRSLTIEAMTVNGAEHEWVSEALDKVFPRVHRHERTVPTRDGSLECRRIRLYGNVLQSFVDRWDLRARGVDMRVPERLLTAPLPVVAAYLRSLFQAEGYVSVRRTSARVGLDMISEDLARGVQQLLARFGIFSRVRFKRDARPDRNCWSLSTGTVGDQIAFAEEIGFLDPRKTDRLEMAIDRTGVPTRETKRLQVERIEDLGPMEVYDIQTESGEYLSSNLRVHNCFILSVEDTMTSILNWYVEEGIIFKGGSGSGINLSRIRSSKEQLAGGGTASGPVSFMRGADASAGTIKSGGKTRRAAKMVVLNVDHPDIRGFIWCKAVEEQKARALRDAGFDMDLDGKDSYSIQYQNANNSVRVTDEFMQAYLDDRDWKLKAVLTGEVAETVRARELMREIAQAAWECADPGMQYDTTINEWHTCPASGRINASNPCCFVGETLVETSDGLIPFDLLEKTAAAGHELPATRSLEPGSGGFGWRQIRHVWVAGHADRLVEVATESGLSLRCTPEHRFLTLDSNYVEARELAVGTPLLGVDENGQPVVDRVRAVVELVPDEPVPVFDLEVEGTHNFGVTTESASAVHSVIVHNSEYMHLDNSACNLASLNLIKFLDEDGNFDIAAFKHAVEIVFTAQEIIVGNSSYPTEKIERNARAFRQLGLGYANLGALLMARGLPYDSDGGRAWAGAITALMTGQAYATSARIAEVMGPFAGFPPNRDAMLRVLRKHRAAADEIDPDLVPEGMLTAAKNVWDEAISLGELHGIRNAQASVLAPTGCLVGGSFVPTERGLVRLASLGDPGGPKWQDLGVRVSTDEGPKEATKFYVNGSESVVTVSTSRGHRIQGTPRHRIKVVDGSGAWVWKRFADVAPGDLVPLALDQLIGEPQTVELPPLPEAYWTGEHHARAPRRMSPELAELVGYFMGDGSLDARGIRLCAGASDFDVVERLRLLGKELFGLEAKVAERRGYTEVAFNSVRLVLWWEACGFAKREPSVGHSGKGYVPHIPDAVLHSNDREVYAAFLRGLFEADGTVTAGYPHWSTTSLGFSHDVQNLLLALGYPTTRKMDVTGWGNSDLAVLRLLNSSYNRRWLDEVGFIGDRKNAAVGTPTGRQSARQDRIPVSRALIDRLAPENDRMRKVLLMEARRTGSVSRRITGELHERTGDTELGHLLRFFYDRVASAELGDDELTYDLSVPENVTYIANGFVSHNTIGLMMDCDTTGIEPDLALVKQKKLVGGGTMRIVNQTVPRALLRMGYTDEQAADVVNYIAEHNSVDGAPHLREEHYPVFDTSMGDRAIHYMGHVRMMAAVQHQISGAISKCVTGDTLLTTEDGLIRIGGLLEDETPDTFRDHVMGVASLDGTRKTDAFYYGGTRPTRAVSLRSGHRVVGTHNHRVMVADEAGLTWRRLDEIRAGEYVAVRYGAEMWAVLPPRFSGFMPSKRYGSQKAVRLPGEMTEELAFLLGAFVAEGHTTRSNWTVTITNADEGVLKRVAEAWRSEFGVEPRVHRQPGKCPGVAISSKTIVEFLEWLGCGARASAKRIPDAVLGSPRSMVLAFLQGLALDAYVVREGRSPKWGICVDSAGLLDDLQAVLTNLGVVHSRIEKANRQNGKRYGEVYASGEHAQTLIRLVGFAEKSKHERARGMLDIDPGWSSADVVPGIAPRDLYELIPTRKSGRDGAGNRRFFGFLLDPRTRHVSRRTLERVAQLPGVKLPEWLRSVLRDDLHFSPVDHVEDAGEREVFDVSVPETNAFVGNGIVNHNTVNMPEEVTVNEVEQLFVEGWRLGLKAVAIYRNNCKVAQPLSAEKKAKEKVEPAVLAEPVRKRLPQSRPSRTISFQVGDAEGYITAGEYPDNGIGEVFLKVAKQGSTLSGVMDAFAIAVSIALQYGVPLETYIEKFINMRFEPSGITNDPDIRFATSLVDYVFRRLALEYLPPEKREALGVRSIDERKSLNAAGNGHAVEAEPTAAEPASTEVVERPSSPVSAADAPLCYVCGSKMQPAGSCYVCPSCGSTSGCS